MAERTSSSRNWNWEGIYGRTKLVTGLILFTFLGTHLLNHALGLVSLQAMEAGAVWFKLLWRNLPATLVLYGALLLHPLLAGYNWLRRGHYRGLPWQAWTQLLLGLTVPWLLLVHLMGSRVVHEFAGVNDSYAFVLNSLFVADPMLGLQQNLLILIAWGHGCFGMYYWLRLKPLFERLWPVFFAIGLLLPACAMLGYLSAGRAVRFLLRDPAWAQSYQASLNWPGDAAVAWVYPTIEGVQYGLAFLMLGGLIGRWLWALLRRSRSQISIRYPDGRQWRGRAGSLSLLEISRAIGYPHASVCGGQGRCSTCRVRLSNIRQGGPGQGGGIADLPPPSAEEQAVLTRVEAPPGVRLACQVRPAVDLAVLPLLPAGVMPKAAYGTPGAVGLSKGLGHGSERRIAILFADLRGFTKLSDGKLPYDVVFILNQYFKAMGEAVERHGGRLDKFIGDGVMALFGLDCEANEACRRALAAAAAMGQAMTELNAALSTDLGEMQLRIGVGIHCGRAIVGEMGHGRATGLTAIGDAVNTASRLESATKDFAAELVISDIVANRAGLGDAAMQAQGFRRETVSLRGKAEEVAVWVHPALKDLP